MAGQLVVHAMAPPGLPETGAREDGILMADLNQRVENEFRVSVWRGKCLGVAKQLKGEESGWVEIIPLPLESNEKNKANESLVARMQGAKGLGVERIFWDRGEQKLVGLVWFGGSLCGWPGVTHGGAIATAMAEKLSLAADLAQKEKTGALAAAILQRVPGTGQHAKIMAPEVTPDEPAQLSIGYVKPTYANKFHIIRVKPAMSQDGESALTPETYGGADYEATLETLDEQTCVKARAKFAPSTALQRAEEKTVGGAKQSYEDFKEWMWPSRQKNSQTV